MSKPFAEPSPVSDRMKAASEFFDGALQEAAGQGEISLRFEGRLAIFHWRMNVDGKTVGSDWAIDCPIAYQQHAGTLLAQGAFWIQAVRSQLRRGQTINCVQMGKSL